MSVDRLNQRWSKLLLGRRSVVSRRSLLNHREDEADPTPQAPDALGSSLKSCTSKSTVRWAFAIEETTTLPSRP